eukprot:gene5234-5895_t
MPKGTELKQHLYPQNTFQQPLHWPRQSKRKLLIMVHKGHPRGRKFLTSVPIFTKESRLQVYHTSTMKYGGVFSMSLLPTGCARFLVESDNFGRVRFKGIQSGRYLCMTKNGVLIAKADRRKGSWRKRKRSLSRKQKRKSHREKFMRRCVFKEVFGRNAYTAYTLAANESWYLATDKDGNPKLGTETRAGLRAVHFIERPIGVKRLDEVMERSRTRMLLQRIKKKRVSQFQSRLRSLPIASSGGENEKVNSVVLSKYLKKVQDLKRELKQAAKGLIRLKRKIDEKKDAATSRTTQIKYDNVFKRILAKLKLAGIVGI